MSMSVSLEVRSPFTDSTFLENLWNIPAQIRCAGAPEKPYEWKLVRRYLGDSYPLHKKQGFTFPFIEWLREGQFSQMSRNKFCNFQQLEAVGLNPRAVNELLVAFLHRSAQIPWSRIWSLYVWVDWCERYHVTL
jgi:asparagine synthase (glutamine-hydrolysing)